ncbi:MAG: HD domain-containing protein [Desulfobacterales bacterium]|nr:HD domain-containing protein [Desulfobacterales bacterium]MCP4159088.1 HD domain-containing protein [Deltaproteobacteria bacterium]
MIDKARKFAILSHGNQKYGDKPYSAHLDAVSEIARDYGEIATVIAFLHDVVEDTSITIEEVEEEFGKLIADCVDILTDEPGKNRKERKAKTYAKMADVEGQNEIALIVKAADRLANMRSCLSNNNNGLFSMYKKEHNIFTESVYRENLCEDIWDEIKQINEK